MQGGSVIKPLVGHPRRGPGDAAVVMPVLGSWAGLARRVRHQSALTATSIRTAMAAAAIDEAVRNVVAVGADPARIAILDNFCWGNTDAAGGARLAGAARPRPAGTWPWRTDAVHQRQGQPQQRVPVGRTSTSIIPPTLLIIRPGPGPRRAPLRQHGPEGGRQHALSWSAPRAPRWAAPTTIWSTA